MRPAPPSLGRALRGERVARHRRGEAAVAVGRGRSGTISTRPSARRSYARAGRGRDLGPHRRSLLRRLGRRPPRGGCDGHGPGAAQGLHSRRAADRGGARGGRRGGAAHRSRARSRAAPGAARFGSRGGARRAGRGAHARPSCTGRSRPGADIVGVNSRDLDTFRIDIGVRLGAARRRCRRDRRRRRERHARRADVERAAAAAPTRCSSGRRSPPPPIRAASFEQLAGVPRRGR